MLQLVVDAPGQLSSIGKRNLMRQDHTWNWVWQEGGGGFSDTQRGGRGGGAVPSPRGGAG